MRITEMNLKFKCSDLCKTKYFFMYARYFKTSVEYINSV